MGLLLAASLLATSSVPATAGDTVESNQDCGGETRPDADVAQLSGPDLNRLVAEARASLEFKQLSKTLRAEGFVAQINAAFGAEIPSADVQSLIVPFRLPDDANQSSDRSAGIVYRVESGEVYVEAGVFELTNIAPDEALQNPEVEVTNKWTVVDGEVVTANSFWECFWACMGEACGAAALFCIWFGPFSLQCFIEVCGVVATSICTWAC
ncbi:MAG: hypothetical protein ABR500_00020 [Dermatophilaceae bacterium]